MDTKYLSPAEAARLIGCSPDNVRYLANEGKLTVAIQSGSGRLFEREEIERFIAERRRQQESKARKLAATA